MHKLLRIAFIVLVFVSTALGQDIAHCRTDLNTWMPMFKATYNAPECRGDGTVACAFATPIKNLTSGQLTTIVSEMDSCAKSDTKGDNYLYQRVATRAENVVVLRTAYFLKDTNQSAAFAAWESKHSEGTRPEAGPKP
jgi:hypothetical protein